MKHSQARNPYGPAFVLASADTHWAWMAPLLERGQGLLEHASHGDLGRWRAALAALPETGTEFSLTDGLPSFGPPVDDPSGLTELLMALHPWRKGPMRIAGVTIDTEWRSDWKWQRIEPHIELRGQRVLDIGCGNGYYGWRMLGHGADFVLGLDPTLVYSMQWLACRHFAGETKNLVVPLGIEDLPVDAGGFDSVFSMGVLYHRKDPVRHLQRLASLARPGGQVVLETLVLEGQEKQVLEPPGRYARMRNVHAVPTVPMLLEWVNSAGLEQARIIDVSPTLTAEQRSTAWMTFESLEQCLDPDDDCKTIEGHPAPVRAALVARAPA